MVIPIRSRDRQLEIRMTGPERDLIDRAAAAAGTDLTSFAVANLTEAAQRVLADREHFARTPEAAGAWDRINRQPARELSGLRQLLERPSPFVE
ncbi:MAG: DUF1778 domain-containing protein [Acidimicrobiia bacterium]